MIRNSVRYVNWQDRKELCADLKTIYTSATEQEAQTALETFVAKSHQDQGVFSYGRIDNENILFSVCKHL
jgi:hypothetical protein